MSQITTHVLDTSIGIPAEGIKIYLKSPRQKGKGWEEIAAGVTNSEGRIVDFLPSTKVLEPGRYRMIFETQHYFENQNLDSFYPYIIVVFQIHDREHYHIPLLLSPFGYSTYRGS